MTGRRMQAWRDWRSRHLRGTVWEPGALDAEVPRRFRPIYTTVIPLKLALFLGFSVAGTLVRVPTVDLVTSVSYGDVWTVMLGVTAALALAGAIFRREQLELYATIALVIGYATYPLGALVLTFAGDADRAPLGIGLWVLIVTPAWRIVDLVRTIRRRREGQAAS